MDQVSDLIFPLAILLMSVVVHEVSHGYAALTLGDRTAQYAGRLTLNPLKHLDPFGSVLLPLLLVIARSPFLFGYARPVPYNPYNLRFPRWGPAMVAAAGPAANLLVAFVFGLVIRFSPLMLAGPQLAALTAVSQTIVLINVLLAVFNLVPIPPLDGSNILFALLSWRHRAIQNFLTRYGFIMLIIFILYFFELLMGPISFLCEFFSGIAC